MTAKKNLKATIRLPEGALSYNRDLLLALNRAAQTIQRARTAEDFYQAVGNEIKSLGGVITLLTVNQDRSSFTVAYTSYESKLLRGIEKIIGQSAIGYSFAVSSDTIYASKLASGNAEYVHWTKEHIVDALPLAVRPMIGQVMSVFNVEQSILASLRVDDETLGLMMVSGLSLNEEDVPIMDSFAGQIAAGLQNVRLMQKLQDELAARRHAEEKLLISQATFEGIFNSITEAVYILDESGVFLKVNSGAEKMYGYPPEYFVGRTPEFVSAPGKNDLAKVMEFISQAYLGETVEFEFWGIRKDGSIFPKDVRLTPGTYFGRMVIIAVGRDMTERHQAEEAIRQTEKHFKALIEKAPDGIVLVGLDGKTEYASPSARGLFGYDMESPIQDNSLEFIHPDDLAAFLQIMNDLIQNPAYIPTLEYRYRHKDGSYLWVESTFRNLLAEPGVQAVVINFRDVTRRRQIEDALKTSEAKYRLLADHTTDTIWLADMNLKTTYISPSLEKIRGYSLEQIQELPLEQNLTSSSFELTMDIFKAEFAKVMADPAYSPVRTMELDFINRDGTIYSTESKVSLIRDENGNPVTILGESRDISERKRIQKALYESERYYRALIENATDGILVVNTDGAIRYESPSVARMLGYAPDALIGTSAFDLINPDDLEQIANAFMEGLNTPGFIHHGEYRLRHCNGEWRYVEIVTQYLMDDPVIAGIIVNGRDITERKQAQEALSASEAELRALFASMQDSVLVIDRDGDYRKIASTNPSKFYTRPQEAIGKNLKDFFHDEQVEKFGKVIQQVLETQQTMQIEYKIDAHGHSPWFESSVSPMDADTTIWVARDITERKQVEAQLHLLHSALEAAANTIVITDRDGIIQWANSSYSSLTGFDRSEAIGKSPGQLMKSGKQSREFYKDLWDTILSGNIWHNELVNRRKDGSFYFEEMTITPLRNSDDEISHFIAVKQDITARKHAEEALVRSEKAYRTLFENMPIGLYRTSVDGEILDANPALIRMLGYLDLQSLREKKAWDYYAEIVTNDKFMAEISKEGSLSAFEAEYRRRDKTTFWAEDYVNIIRDEAGNSLYYEGSLINITDRKKVEDDLRQANMSLEIAHSELKQMFANEQVLARTDSLTSQTNRRHFFELASREFIASIRYLRALTIILFDIDGFKQVNDTFGHALGDNILVQVAQATASQVRDVDVLARYGGDEFIILLPQTGAQQAFLIAERIRRKVETVRMENENSPFIVTLSIGVAEIIHAPQDESIEDVIRRADQALYQAKNNGRNHTIIYTEL